MQDMHVNVGNSVYDVYIIAIKLWKGDMGKTAK